MLNDKTKHVRIKKTIAVFMLFTLVNQTLAPSIAYALTAGPTAPEATNFEPIDTTDMVNPLTGSFTYGMPLLEVPGPEGSYPLALSYHAGIQPNEEASWVGLGWSLNPGAITRNVNGYPDDWKATDGAGGTTSSYWSGGQTTTFSVGITIGVLQNTASVNFGLSFAQDTYRGFGIGSYAGVSFQLYDFGDHFKTDVGALSLGVQVGVNPYGGTYAGSNVSIESGRDNSTIAIGSLSIGLQTNFKTTSAGFSGGISSGNSRLGASIGSGGLRTSFSVGGGATSSVNNSNSGKITTTTESVDWQIPIPVVSLSLGYTYERYWSATTDTYFANGVLNNRYYITSLDSSNPYNFYNTDDDNFSVIDPINSNTSLDPLTIPGGTFPNFDDYNVTAQGLGGSIRPYILSSLLFNQNRFNNNNHSHDVIGEFFNSNNVPNTIGNKWQFRFINDLSNSYRQQPIWNSDQGFGFDGNPQYGKNDGTYGYDPSTNRLEGSNHIEYFTNADIVSNKAAGRGFITIPDEAGFSRANCPASQIGGFMITNSSGVTYHYALPVYSFGEQVNSQNINDYKVGKYSNQLNKNTKYAYTWYLTAITGPDYISRGATSGLIDKNDWGYWVKFDYGEWSKDYTWRTPSQGYNYDIDYQFENMSSGHKEVYYLDAIETRTHTALFEKELRADGKSLFNNPYSDGVSDFQLKPGVICSNNADGCVPDYAYPVPSLRLKSILLIKNEQLGFTLNSLRMKSNLSTFGGIYNFAASTSNSDGSHNSIAVDLFDSQNVIDTYDIQSSGLQYNCLRRVLFNYDYSLCPGAPNSFDPNGQIYSLTPNTNTFANLGKLTLLSIDFQGKNGSLVTPPVLFKYDLDPNDPANQNNITITQVPADQTTIINSVGAGSFIHDSENQYLVNQTGSISVQTPGKFNTGDIIKFVFNGLTYYCTLLSTPDNGNNYQVLFLNNPQNSDPGQRGATQLLVTNISPGTASLNISIPAVKTKNPPYNYDAYDNWQCYKSDYTPNIANNNLGRYTTPVSNMSTDVWSLRTIVSSLGSNILINYEGNTYKKSVLSRMPSFSINSGNEDPNFANNGIIDLIPDALTNTILTNFFTTTKSVKGFLLFYRIGTDNNNTNINTNQISDYQVINLDSYPQTKILTIGNNDLNVQLDNSLLNFLKTNSIKGKSTTVSKIHLTSGNVIPNILTDFNYGGGIRVKSIKTDNMNGEAKQTVYTYNDLGISSGGNNSSGVTSYYPDILDPSSVESGLKNDLSLFTSAYVPSANDQTNALNTYKGLLYKDASYLTAISRFVPSPGVMYETVSVNDYSIPLNGNPVPIVGTTVYQYEVFKPEMIGLKEYYYEMPYSNPNGVLNPEGTYYHTSNSTSMSGLRIVRNSARDISIKDYSSRVGSLKRVVTYDNYGNKLTEKINHYLYDDLENTSFQNQINNYEPRLATFEGINNYKGAAYNDIGVIKERYGTARAFVDPAHVSGNLSLQQYDEMLIMSNKETFPAIQTGTTQIDYKNGTRMDQTNLAFDFYTGAVTQTLTTDSYGNHFLGVATPAYMAGYNNSDITTLVYPALGLKTHDDDNVPFVIQHKQMLSQQASNYTFTASIDAYNNITKLGVVTASAQTWSNTVPVLDPNGITLSDNSQSNIWRMEKSFKWMPTGTAPNNVQPASTFADYFGTANGGSANTAWKKTSQITKYNVYSAALEASDIDNNFAATRMGYNNTKVLFTVGIANYNEIAYAGAEDALLSNGNFSNQISPGAGTVVADSSKAHSGINSLMVPAASNGFTYTVPVSVLNAVAQNYSVAVWVKPASGNSISGANLYYQVNGGSIVTPAQTYSKTAGGYYLLEITVPASALSGGNLVVGCSNSTPGVLYFDDFRFQPTAAAAIAYVYDNVTGELTYILGNNNLYTRFQYDAIGRLIRTYKEVLGKANIPLMKSVNYNYGRGN